jgi:hypothetical protein
LDLDAKRRRMTYVAATDEELYELLATAELESGSQPVLRLRVIQLGLTNDMREAVRLLGAVLDEVESTDSPVDDPDAPV